MSYLMSQDNLPASPQSPRTSSITDDSSALVSRLREIALRVDTICSQIYGDGDKAGEPAPGAQNPMQACIRNHVGLAHEVISMIEAGLTRIESRL